MRPLHGCTLLLHGGAGPGPRHRFSAPTRWVGAAGSCRVGSAGVAWGPAPDAHLEALVAAAPEAAVLVVCDAEQPQEGPLADPRVYWLRPAGLARVEVVSLPPPGGVELRVLGEG